jgi:hypothetical protein
MKRFMYIVLAAATFALTAGVVAAEGGTRPDDRATHGPGAIALDGSGAVRPDDRATHGPGAIGLDATVAVRPDDRPTHGPGLFATDSSNSIVRPDDRAWRGIGPAPTSVPFESTSVRADGFDWADAGIGAAGAFGLGLLLVGGAVLALRRQRVESFS